MTLGYRCLALLLSLLSFVAAALSYQQTGNWRMTGVFLFIGGLSFVSWIVVGWLLAKLDRFGETIEF